MLLGIACSNEIIMAVYYDLNQAKAALLFSLAPFDKSGVMSRADKIKLKTPYFARLGIEAAPLYQRLSKRKEKENKNNAISRNLARSARAEAPEMYG